MQSLDSSMLHPSLTCEFCPSFTGMSDNERAAVLAAWSAGQVRIICATIAFGMGIDKKEVRFVVHTSIAKSLEGYFQEVGRAGRDGLPARCVLFYRKADVGKLKTLIMGPFGGRGKGKKRKARDLEKLRTMQDFCEERRECRRVMLGEHFGYKEAVRCEAGCDNCQRESAEYPEVSFLRWAQPFREGQGVKETSADNIGDHGAKGLEMGGLNAKRGFYVGAPARKGTMQLTFGNKSVGDRHVKAGLVQEEDDRWRSGVLMPWREYGGAGGKGYRDGEGKGMKEGDKAVGMVVIDEDN